ncbi:hypothetical protein C3709_18190 [Lelliottia aquatilis]|uniref:Uncharacterized protein n=1 Tax=Lelliottia aquatilis TaxID=2080838 RepID=A0ABX4ZZ96_9ENTR|nr:hypothetical protein C3Z09_17295 [Lelliottia aquatilis]POZ16972.1 hypothetical protein C3708_19475 [Lelliottia sp. 7254-16]POZ20972.1 hypothetical protein C3712_17540 [Lelliottia aquatilis]POZ22690.1 hypothetical protein C3711_18285 [Lelliottia aquatilis]POZ31318.1 hypothetical protein C3710_18795 [Lelliottia aquatilis]
MRAVVPCQWRRIIGSSQTLTTPLLKKTFNRLFFAQNRATALVFRAFQSHTDVKRAKVAQSQA